MQFNFGQYIFGYKQRFLIVVSAFCLFAGACQGALASIIVSNERPKQGETIQVIVQSDEEAEKHPQVSFCKENFQAFIFGLPKDGRNSYRALIAIPADLEPGQYKINCGNETKLLNVVSANFPVQKLSLPKSKDNFITSPGEEDAFNKAKSVLSDTKHWSGAFVLPSKARMSAGFGLRRMVNGKLLKDYYHSGVDFAGGQGSPVNSVADGVVIMAKNGWRLHGNSICIDHGQGVVSIYIHLSKVLVKEGDTVKSGQLIGRIGQTGRANGPHLHFSLYVNKHSTNPLQWFKTAF